MSKRLPLITLMIAALALTGCGDSNPSDRDTEKEIDLLNQKLSSGKSFSQACQELDVLCQTTGFGCKAHNLFCQVPNKQTICQQLAAKCATYSAACDVYNNHCKGTDGGPPPSLLDGGPPPPPIRDGGPLPQEAGYAPDQSPPPPGQCGDNICDHWAGERCDNCPQDCCPNSCGECIPPTMDAGPPWPGQCGDNYCDHWAGEDCQNCPMDCCPGQFLPDASPYWPDAGHP